MSLARLLSAGGNVPWTLAAGYAGSDDELHDDGIKRLDRYATDADGGVVKHGGGSSSADAIA